VHSLTEEGYKQLAQLRREWRAFARGPTRSRPRGTFDSPPNYRFLAEHGYSLGSGGVTPELMIDICNDTFSQFGLPVEPVGEAAGTADQWLRFLARSKSVGHKGVSVWRYGSADPEIWTVLKHSRGPKSLVNRSSLRIRFSAKHAHLKELIGL
jgi:hypothetical protein